MLRRRDIDCGGVGDVMKLTREQILEASDEELNKLVNMYVMNYAAPDGTPFSTDISAAWQVVEKVKDLDKYGFDICCGEWGYTIQVGFYDEVMAEADTAPRAICRAALLIFNTLLKIA